MRIDSIKLHNFQGMSEYEAVLNGKSADFYGDNATGKTTVCNAISWMLYGKPSTDVKSFSPKNVGNREEAQVTMIIILDDGMKVALQKTYKEIWKKKRGRVEPEYAGDTTEYYIDGRKVKESEYQSEVSTFLGDTDKVKILSIPTYFAGSMPWTERRDILMELYGSDDVDEKILESEDFKDLRSELLGKDGMRPKDIGDVIETTDTARKAANKRLIEMDGRMEEVNRRIKQDGKSADELSAEIDALNAKLVDLKAGEKSAAMASTAELNLKIAEMRENISKKKLEYEAKESKASRVTKKAFDEITAQEIELSARKIKLEAELAGLSMQIKSMKTEREKTLAEYNEVFARQWDDKNSVCPTCKRPYPDEDVQRHKQEFNVERSKKLEEIRERGNQVSKEAIAALEGEKASVQHGLDMIQGQMLVLKEKRKDETSKIKPVKEFELTEEYQGMIEQVHVLEKQRDDIETITAIAARKSSEKIEELERVIRAKQSDLVSAQISESAKNQLEELGTEKKQIAIECEQLESKMGLCKYFVWKRLQTISEFINSHFDGLRFQMFKAHIDSLPSQICEAEVNDKAAGGWTPYRFTNDARRVQEGIQIINTLSKEWNMSIPLLIDNAESITRLPETNMQVLRFVVSEKHKELTCVVSKSEDCQIVLN